MNWRTFYADSDDKLETRGVRATERPVSFIPKGALTHHPEGAVVFPAATVRSARRMRLLRKPYGQCHSSAALLSLSTQAAICFAFSSKQLFLFWKQLAACLRKSAIGSFIAIMGIAFFATPIFFLRKRNKKPKDERTVRTNGDLPLGSKGGQQRYGTICGCRFRLSELYQYSQ